MCGLAANTSNSGSGGPGFKLGPLCCFLRQGTLLLVVFPHPGVKMGTSDILPGGGGGEPRKGVGSCVGGGSKSGGGGGGGGGV